MCAERSDTIDATNHVAQQLGIAGKMPQHFFARSLLERSFAHNLLDGSQARMAVADPLGQLVAECVLEERIKMVDYSATFAAPHVGFVVGQQGVDERKSG